MRCQYYALLISEILGNVTNFQCTEQNVAYSEISYEMSSADIVMPSAKVGNAVKI